MISPPQPLPFFSSSFSSRFSFASRSLHLAHLSLSLYLSPFDPQEAEARELAKTMMGKKTKRLYGRMQHGIQQKKDAVQALQDKQQRLEQEKAEKAAAESAKDNKGKGKGKGKGAGPAAKPTPAKKAKKA
jgi:hypothetical protein